MLPQCATTHCHMARAVLVVTMDLLAYNKVNTNFLIALLTITCLGASYCVIIEDSQTFANVSTTRPEVRIPQGTIRGIHMLTHHGRKIFAFKGIPYAEPPIGNLRFKGPVPAGSWNGILDASMEPNLCPYVKNSVVVGDEDCLYLRVYTPWLPENDNTTLLPVMVYIFGGGFNVGYADPIQYGPHFLLDKDMILVVPSYRLSVLGFLSTGDDVCPGNYGLKDIVQALKWTKENIRYFGGDSSRVTLAGGSSGGMSAELLTLSNSTKGLFHRIITQSGSALCPEAHRPISTFPNRAIQLGKYLGCSTNTSLALVECLKGIETSTLINTDQIFYVWQNFPMNIWGPSIEPDIEEALLTDTVANLLRTGKNQDLPRLSLVTPQEGVYYHAVFYKTPELVQDFLHKIDIILPAILTYDFRVENVTAYTAALMSYYLNDLTADKNLLVANITDLIGDALFNYPFYRSLQLHLRHKKSPQYLCSFEYRGVFSHSYGQAQGAVDWGAVHGDETVYLFQSPSGLYGAPDWIMSETDWKMVDLMVQLWTSFVTNGIPTLTDANSSTIWEPYSSRRNHLQIGSNSEVSLSIGYNFFEPRAKFWDDLIPNDEWK